MGAVMGWIKQWSYKDEDQVPLAERFGWLQCTTSVLSFAAVCVMKQWVDGIVNDCKKQVVSTHENYNWKELMRSIQIRAGAASFQLGNVFYEILFAGVNLDTETSEISTWIYFSLAMVTFGLGLVNVV